MIEATCTACGTINRIADADVPVGARFVNCASCKSRVAISGHPAASGKAAPVPSGGPIDLADLPAPRRPSALASEPPRSGSRPGLSAALSADEPELPAPRAKRMSTGPNSVPPGVLDLEELGPGDTAGFIDLPAPRGAPSRVPDARPAGEPTGPRRRDPSPSELPMPRAAGGRAMTDLPVPPPAAPPKAAGIADLPAPRAPQGIVDLPAPRAPQGIVDLPAPRARQPGIPAIPPVASAAKPTAPATSAGKATANPTATLGMPLPSVKPAAPRASGGIPDLPSPKAGPGDLLTPKTGPGDLLTPKAGPGDLLTPKAGPADLLTPKVGPGDLLTPSTRNHGDLTPSTRNHGDLTPSTRNHGDLTPKPGGPRDLPAPKGFFDDLPQAAAPTRQPGNEIAPKGFFDDLPQAAAPARQPGNEIAPQGFFDDLPQAAAPARQPGNEIAPKGFFDDLPQAAGPARQPGNDIAPKGFFDDLPAHPPAKPGTAAFLPPGSAAVADAELDLDAIELSSEHSQAGIELQLEGEGEGDSEATDIDLDEVPRPRAKAPSVLPLPSPGPSTQFDDLDLSSPSPVSFTSKPRTPDPAAGAPPASVATVRTPMAPGGQKQGTDVSLELEEPREAGALGRLAPKRATEPAAAEAAANPAKQKRRGKLLAVAAVGVLALGGGGFFMYQRHVAAQEHQEALDNAVSSAQRMLAQGKWPQANTAARRVLELDAKHPEALGIAAEALFAQAIADAGPPAKYAQARKQLSSALEAGVQHPAIERAQALSPIAANQPDSAIPRLQALMTRAPKDGSLALYLGWAHAARGDLPAAIKAYDQAVAHAPVKQAALFARAKAKQAMADLEGARADYAAVLELVKDHIGAQVGLAASLPAAQAQQQEEDLLALLALKDLEKKDPRAAVHAWSLAAVAATRGGRLDVARERYRKALAIAPQDLDALIGLAEVELRDGKLEVAADSIGKALTQAPDNVRAHLAATAIAIKSKKLDDAAARIKALAERKPPPPVVEQARLQMLAGELLEARGQEAEAIEAYLEAAKLAGDLDLTPTLTAATKLTQLAEKADKAKEEARAAELRARADALLGNLADNAKKDPQLALTLGMAYLQANEAEKAEPWLRQVTDQRPKDVDAQYQLAKALALLGRHEEAIDRLRLAVELDPARSEIGLALARTYEDSKRDTDAARLYDKLLAAKEPSLQLRIRAGRFYARIDDMAKAGVQGMKILEADPENTMGLYLKAEGLLRAGKTAEARALFQQATEDKDPLFFDGLGRAAEKYAQESGDSKYQDTALRAYKEASELDPTLLSSLVGQGRLYVLRGQDKDAVAPLTAASKIKMTAEIARLLGLAAEAMQQAKAAAAWLELSDKLEPNALTSWRLAELYTSAALNQPRKAVSALGRATQLAEKAEKDTGVEVAWLTEALHKQGDINRTLGNDAAARTAWEKYLARNPKGPAARIAEVKHVLATSLKRP